MVIGYSLLLVALTFIWGTTFVVTRHALDTFPASAIVAGRFLVAAVVLSPWLRFDRRLWVAAVELGLVLWLGYATQTIGLRYTTVARSAFLTSACVIFVPVLGALSRRRPRMTVWVCAVVATIGVYLLCNDDTPINRGDVWTLGCAVTWGLYILRLEHHAVRHGPFPLTAAQLWVVTALSILWWGTTTPMHVNAPIPWLAIGYLGLAATAGTTLLQTIGQKHVPAPQAAVIYTLEPLWATAFGWFVRGEHVGRDGFIGAALILTAAVAAQVPVRRVLKRFRADVVVPP